MGLELGQWIFDFQITDHFTHSENYTVYRIQSMVFPVNIPESLTCLTVWKRFNEIKKLHKSIVKHHKRLKLPGNVPQIADHGFFQRLKPEAIEHRIEFILFLLNFIAQHPPLYKCFEFLNFFELSRLGTSPSNSQNVYSIKPSIRCDSTNKIAVDNNKCILNTTDDELYSPETSTSSSDQSTKESKEIENCETSTPTLMSPIITETFNMPSIPTNMINTKTVHVGDYIYDAALKFSEAVRSEVNQNYREAFQLYKYGIDILMGGARFDVQVDRKRIAKDKLQKYIKKAQYIYDTYILNEFNDIDGVSHLVNYPNNRTLIERPINQLAKYKVVKILENVMQVQDVTNKKVYIMKAIDKPSPNNKPSIINLPNNIPFMVPLLAYFNTDTKIYLLLQQASGGRLQNYINTFNKSDNNIQSYPNVISDETKFSDNHKSVTSNEKPNSECIINSNYDNTSDNADISNIVNSSRQLLKSVSNALQDFSHITDTTKRESKISDLCIPNNRISNGLNKIPNRTIRRWASEILTALIYLHSMDIICMDLNINNILLGSNGEILLSYFYRQECTQKMSQKLLSLNAIDTLCVAPERPLTNRSDWWSFGIVLFELLTGYTFVSCHPGGVWTHFEIQYPDVEIDEDSRDLLQGLLKIDPKQRFDETIIREHEFFRNIDWKVLCDFDMIPETEYIYFEAS